MSVYVIFCFPHACLCCQLAAKMKVAFKGFYHFQIIHNEIILVDVVIFYITYNFFVNVSINITVILIKINK